MTRFLKLVRHQNGSWQALPTESEEALCLPFFDNITDDAPIDPAHLLKALDPLLLDDCGIKDGSASQFSSLMKKFSKKLVSRCVYVNVLKVTKPEVLEKLLDQGGWNTINGWLADATDAKNQVFLIKLLELFKLLPMTVGRLKENNTPKLVKTLTSFDSEYIQTLSRELVTKWMTQINDEKEAEDEVENIIEKIEKPEKILKVKVHKDKKDHKKSAKKDSPIKKKKEKISQNLPKSKGKKRSSSEKSDLLCELSNNEKAEVNGEPLPKKSKLNLSKSKKASIEKLSPINERIKTDLKPLLKSEEKSVLRSESKGLLKSESKTLPKSELKALSKSESKTLLKSDLITLPKSNLKTLSKSELKTVPKSESKTVSKSESKTVPKSDLKAPKSESKALSKTTLKSESKALTKSELKLSAKSESKFGQKSETKNVSKSDSKLPLKSDSKTVKSDSKLAVKSESKSELFHKKSKILLLNRPTIKKNLSPTVDEDVKIELGSDLSPKKSKLERPKTVKSFKGKFRPTGLEEAAPLPKKIPKKVPTIDKSAAAVAAKNAVVKRLATTLPERITEKKIKPESLLNISETPAPPSGGIKLIAAKPRPIHILQESGFFMDALDAALEYPVRKKKKPGPKPITKLASTAPPPISPMPATPTSPPIKAPKLQFYKDTLEEEATKTEEKEKKSEDDDDAIETKTDNEESSSEVSKTEENVSNDNTTEEKPEEKVIETTENAITEEPLKSEILQEIKDEIQSENSSKEPEPLPLLPSGLRSILSHSRKNRLRKTVKWVDDANLKQMHYFELDETERVNVLKKAFGGDLKSIEAKREREFFEAAKRQAGDKMEETISWWIVPIVVKAPPLLVEPGCFSQEKETQNIHQQSVLQALYFTRDSIPDSAQEPDPEHVAHQDPKIIPLDEENVLGSIIDYTSQKTSTSKPALPEVLTSLMSTTLSRTPPVQANHIDQLPQNPLLMPPQTVPSTAPYDPGEPVSQPPTSVPQINPLQQIPVSQSMFNSPQIPIMDTDHRIPIPNNWGAISPPMMVQEPQFFQPNMFPPMNINPYTMMDPNMPPPLPIPVVPPSTGGGSGGDREEERRSNNNNNKNNNNHSNMRQMQQRGRPLSHMGQSPFPRQQGPRGRGPPRVPCRHFAANGRCRFGANCTFLHPGVNGPPL